MIKSLLKPCDEGGLATHHPLVAKLLEMVMEISNTVHSDMAVKIVVDLLRLERQEYYQLDGILAILSLLMKNKNNEAAKAFHNEGRPSFLTKLQAGKEKVKFISMTG